VRILHVLHHYFPILDGYTIRSMYILRHQRALGLEVSVLTSAQQGRRSEGCEDVEGVPVFRTAGEPASGPPGVREARNVQRLRRRLLEVVESVRPDVIHAHSPSIVALPSLLVARSSHLPCVYEVRDLWENASVDRGKFTERSPLYSLARTLDTYILRRADAVVAICHSLADHVGTRMRRGSMPYVVPNGVDDDAFKPLTARPEWKERWGVSGGRVIGHIGGFQPYEGLDVLINALPSMVRELPGLKLLLVGSGEQESQLRAVASRLGLNDQITFAGRVEHGAVREAYSVADLLVYPRIATRTTNLTTPLKPLEAMAMEKPVMLSDLPPMRELVEPGVSGFLCQPGSAAELARSCVAALSDPLHLSRVAAGGRERVRRERTWSTVVARYQAVYADVVGGGGGSEGSGPCA
jgi:PEP-CTERM/exosortase A-associated glycosyltransferase